MDLIDVALFEHADADRLFDGADALCEFSAAGWIRVEYHVTDVFVCAQVFARDVGADLGNDRVEFAQNAWHIAVKVQQPMMAWFIGIVTAGRAGQINLGRVDRAGGRSMPDKISEFFGNLCCDVFLRFDGAAADVWRENDIVDTADLTLEGLFARAWFLREDIERRAAHLPGVERFGECFEVDDVSSGVVDEHRAGFHFCKAAGVH